MAHINQEQRYTIYCMLLNGKSQKEIAEILGRDKSVISREISRNSDKRSGKYNYKQAQKKCEDRKKNRSYKIRFTSEVQAHVENRLSDKLSPEQIVGEAKEHGIECVSHERIYQHIWDNKQKGGRLHTHLRNKGRRYRKRGSPNHKRCIIENRIDIEKRPKIVEQKERFGDFEIDTIIGKNHKGAMVTILDRASGLVKIRKVNAKEARVVARATISALKPYKDFIHTITSDNGTEFADHQFISHCLDVDFFFAKPYASYQRGANENVNRLIRQYFPKKTDFNKISDQRIKIVENDLNNRPRKRLHFKSPIDIFEKLTQVAFTA